MVEHFEPGVELLKNARVMPQDKINVATAITLLERALAYHSERGRSHILKQFLQEIEFEKSDLPIS